MSKKTERHSQKTTPLKNDHYNPFNLSYQIQIGLSRFGSLEVLKVRSQFSQISFHMYREQLEVEEESFLRALGGIGTAGYGYQRIG